MTSPNAEARPRTGGSRGTAAAMKLARGLLLLAGAVTLFGAGYFTFFASAEEGGVTTDADWVVAICALALAVAYIAAAARIGRHPSLRALTATAGIVLAHVAFGLVKLIGYDETESVPFFVVDLAILASLAVVRRSR